jgi:hypothetical protein
MTVHREGQIVVRDPSTGVEGTGPTYLDALRAFEQNRAA